ncbi:hypothetical protein E2C01_052735 [Portunus trituberculatus]|uniref:Uncharacterized protein n=1 Tax=Portunus trituberculatus TaxID=210409 RepID=A0A5B7GMM6_PORTR|nr:hypothetical protein [Portunus trituberculatus]
MLAVTIASRIKPCRTLMVSCARGSSAGSVTYHCLSMRLIVYADWFCSLRLKRRPMKKKKHNYFHQSQRPLSEVSGEGWSRGVVK